MRYLVTAIVTLEHVDYFAPKETVIISIYSLVALCIRVL